MIKQLYNEGDRRYTPDIKYDDETKTLYIGKDVNEKVYIITAYNNPYWGIERDYVMDYLVDKSGKHLKNLDVEHVVVDKDNSIMKIVDGCLIKSPDIIIWVPENHDIPNDNKYKLLSLEVYCLAEKKYNTLIIKTGILSEYDLRAIKYAKSIKRIIFPVQLDEIEYGNNINNYEIRTKTNEPEILLLIGSANNDGELKMVKK